MFTGKANSTNFDEEQEDGELKSSPSENVETNITAETLKGTEIHIDDGVMIDRTESIFEIREETNDESSSGESGWVLKMRRSMLSTVEPEIKADEGEPPAKRAKMSCFNCGGDHQLMSCPDPRDNQRIKQAANEFKEKKRLNESINSARYHQDTPTKGSEFRPGRLSNTLREALGIGPDDIPEWIYRMRRMGFINGYPPGYLKQAVEKEDRPDVTLQFHLVDDEVKETKESDQDVPLPKLNDRKMIYYMGFNKTYRHLNDREQNFRVPPFDDFCKFHQDHLTEKFWIARKEKKLKGKEKYDKRRKAKGLKEEGDIVCLQPQSFNDDALIIIDRNPTNNEGPAEPPLETNVSTVMEIKTIPLEIDESSEPSSNNRQETPNSTVSLGTPVLIRKNDKGEHFHNTLPSLEAFSKGITPFQAKEEPTPHRGFLKRIFAKIKSVTGTSTK